MITSIIDIDLHVITILFTRKDYKSLGRLMITNNTTYHNVKRIYKVLVIFPFIKKKMNVILKRIRAKISRKYYKFFYVNRIKYTDLLNYKIDHKLSRRVEDIDFTKKDLYYDIGSIRKAKCDFITNFIIRGKNIRRIELYIGATDECLQSCTYINAGLVSFEPFNCGLLMSPFFMMYTSFKLKIDADDITNISYTDYMLALDDRSYKLMQKIEYYYYYYYDWIRYDNQTKNLNFCLCVGNIGGYFRFLNRDYKQVLDRMEKYKTSIRADIQLLEESYTNYNYM